jgi:bacillithiol biosynthesis cysteine-adding enzyme BshC
LERLLHPSALYREFLRDPVRIARFYPADHRDLTGLAVRAAGRAYPADRRATMGAILRRQAGQFGVAGDSRDALAAFERGDAVAVVAGQQPGLFGGPLYTLYKALTAVALARGIGTASGRPAVPIFWVASDDHDFEEVRRAHLNDGGPEPRPFEYPADAAPRGVSLARVRIGDAVEPLLAGLEALLPSSEFRAPLLERLRDAYAPGRTWSEAFARFAGGMLAPLGALVFDPSDEEAKRLALPVFEREIALGGASARAAREVGEALERTGYHAQISRTGDELNLFWHGEHREALRVAPDGRLRLVESGRTLAPEELLRMLRERPADASPGVLLRPLVQDHLFPTAAYVGGPAEVAYWAQVGALYPLFGLEATAVAPRAGATLLEPRIAKILDRFGLGWDALAGDVEHTIGEALRRMLPEDFPALFAHERAGWQESFGRLRDAVTAFDPSLRSAAETAAGHVTHQGEALERKLMQVWKRRQEESVAQIRRAAGQLFPHGGLQERTLSILGFSARYGPGLLPRIAAALPAPGTHALIELGGDA